MIPRGYQRATRARRCPICGRPDWCLVAIDGTTAICPRVESAKQFGEAGYLHQLEDARRLPPLKPRRPRVEPDGPAIDCAALMQPWRLATTTDVLIRLADDLGVSRESLRRLGCLWAEQYQAWAFPMRDAADRVIGIRTRKDDGEKKAVRGSRSGLFIPRDLGACAPLLVCEGPTDSAALLDLGFDVIGRPDCASGTKFILEFVRARRVRDVVIFADADGPGLRGAEKLAAELWVPTRIVAPPRQKDARAWVNAGATRAAVDAVIRAAGYVRRKVPA